MRKQYTRVQYNAFGQKQCTKCGEYKETFDFHKYSKAQDNLKPWCKPCVRSYDLSEDDPKRKMPRKYLDGKMHCRDCEKYFFSESFTLRKGNTTRCNECAIIHQHKKTIKKHGITYERYIEIYNQQNGKCKICNNIETSYRSRLSIDHDHSCCPGSNSCGKCIRGLLCTSCNMALGSAKDSVEILQNMINYLKNNFSDII
jgi:hypothetical protein